MKKILTLLLFLAIGVFIINAKTQAGGPPAAAFDFSPSPSSAVADGQAAITLSIHAYYYKCSQPDQYGAYRESTDPNFCAANGYGAANKLDQKLTGLTAVVSGDGTTVSPTGFSTDASGRASLTVKSTVAGTKSVILYGYNSSYEFGRTSVTFTPVPVSAPPAATPKKSAPAPVTQPAPTQSAPTAPALAAVQVDSEPVDTAKPITLNQSKPLQLSGTTIPNGVITLTIHSTPRTVTVTADKDGHWNYTVSGLEAGDHYVEVAVTDPATNKTSATMKLLSFTLTAAPKATIAKTVAATPSKPSAKPVIIGLVVVAGLGVGAIWYFWRKRVKRNRAGLSDKKTDIEHDTSP